jgi:uncharacterized phage protein (TIGR01671 family)
MKRQLKFRAFFKDDMHYNHSVSLSLNGIVHYLDTDGEWKCDIEGNGEDIGVIVMQYTGLNDRHGTEIYEGDIVKRTTFNYDYDDVDNPTAKKYVEQVSFIEYRNNGFWVNMENFGWEGENLWNWDLMEVIGNIYQNAELLKEAVK